MKTVTKKTAGAKSTKKATKKAKTDIPRRATLGSLFGLSVVSVIRAMGKAGWNYEKAKAALDSAKIPAADHTIRIGLKRGRDGEKKIASLNAKEWALLRAGAKTKSQA
jgi:hypothetical protein